VAELAPVTWPNLIKRLSRLSFDGPYRGGKHPYMIKGSLVLTVPNPHRKQIGVPLLLKILKQAQVSKEEWLGE
jgi:predicted RNA binding protein YcfA (HicA-like mRNA interferase family)